MKPLGVGLVFTPMLLPLVGEGSGAVSVLEVEPQTLWQLSRRDPSRPYSMNQERLAQLAALPQSKLLHSVGLPVGGSKPHEPAQLELLRSMAEALDPAWVSEHLSFNSFHDSDGWVSAAFLLPPRQVDETVALAARRVRDLAQALDRPVAFETGVNYLSTRPDELGDGRFFRGVAEAADCGILLDLHNVLANGRNGRDAAADTLASLPLDRVWEIHLAGGMELDGYWLDAHSGAVPEEALDLAAEWIPRMPNLGALVFEILDEHVETLGLGGVLRQLEKLRQLWRLRSSRREIYVARPGVDAAGAAPALDGPQAWEYALGGLVIGRRRVGPQAAALCADPGLAVLCRLVSDARAGFVTQGLRHTMTLLIASLGAAAVRDLLVRFTRSRPPELFVSAEAGAFAAFLVAEDVQVPYLREVLGFEHALIRAVLNEASTEVPFDHDPGAVFESLEAGTLPHDLPLERSTLLVRPGVMERPDRRPPDHRQGEGGGPVDGR